MPQNFEIVSSPKAQTDIDDEDDLKVVFRPRDYLGRAVIGEAMNPAYTMTATFPDASTQEYDCEVSAGSNEELFECAVPAADVVVGEFTLEIVSDILVVFEF